MESTGKKKSGPKPQDLTNKQFGRLRALSYAGSEKWMCVCDCGKEHTAASADLKRGKVRSCGCLQLEVAKSGDCRRTHGMADTPEYRTWQAMLYRTGDPRCNGYERYGGRGITVCERWKTFENFYADMGPRSRGTTLERNEVDGNYEPSNCRWATRQEQGANMSTTVLLTANGRTQPMEAWAREIGCSTQALRYRLKKGWSHEKAINTPIRKHTVY
jgi:hypothetical protein